MLSARPQATTGFCPPKKSTLRRYSGVRAMAASYLPPAVGLKEPEKREIRHASSGHGDHLPEHQDRHQVGKPAATFEIAASRFIAICRIPKNAIGNISTTAVTSPGE